MKRRVCVLAVIVLSMIVSLCACANGDQQQKPNKVESDTVRVVSLAPSVTEILFAIGADDMIVGRTDYCDYPESALQIDSVGTFSSPNMELIIEKMPQFVISSDFVDENIKSQLEAIGATVYVVTASNVNEIENEIIKIGEMLGLSDNAQKVVDGMKATAEQVSGMKKSDAKTVFYDLGSFYSVGGDSFLGNVLNDIGVINIAADSGDEWPHLSVETIVEANPEIYISSYTNAAELKEIAGLNTLACLQEPNLIILDEALAECIQRPGPRIVEAELKLAGLIYGK